MTAVRHGVIDRILVGAMGVPGVCFAILVGVASAAAIARGDNAIADQPAALQPASPAPAPATTRQFKVTFDKARQAEPYSGRVYLFLSESERGEPRRRANNWFQPPQMFSMDVKDVPVGGSLTIDGAALSFPKKMADLKARKWLVQAVARRSLNDPVPGQGEGDLYSEPMTVDLSGGQPAVVPELVLSKVVESTPFRETESVKLFEMVSPLLSKHTGREVKVRAGVVLPEGWTDDAQKHWPAVYFITGFGGDHRTAGGMAHRSGQSGKVLTIVPDPTCLWGHSVFADSETNGPWGQMLISELIPAIEKKYHGPQDQPELRFTTGVSSGGWSSLWLVVTYPDHFNSCWSHVPDPVDFRDFQQINLTRPGENMFKDPSGARRGLARNAGSPTLFYDDFVAMEEVLGPGGQIMSFEAVFSPRGPDGKPLRLFDRTTGAIDPAVAKAWEKYDIRLILEQNWATLGPKLKGKIHVFAGAADTFYLDGAARLLRDSLARLGSDADVQIIDNMIHTIYGKGVNAMYDRIAEVTAKK